MELERPDGLSGRTRNIAWRGQQLWHSRRMHYLSERALLDLDDGSRSTTTTREFGVQKGISAQFGSSTVRVPSTGERLDSALRRIRHRQVHTHLLDPVVRGQIVDLAVPLLEVGVMPFAYFGDRVNGPYGEAVKVFWGHGTLDRYEMTLLGSLDNVRSGHWADPNAESALKIGHNFPSDPSVLSEIVASELALEGVDIEEHVSSVRTFEWMGPGEAARFALEQTRRAEQTKVVADGYARHWQRQLPILRSRVVGTVTDVDDESNSLLVRPVYIADIT